jgi:hypothetical protein
MSTYHHIQQRKPDPMDIIIILLLIGTIIVSGLALYNAGKEIARQFRAYDEVGTLFDKTWTGHNETKLLALSLTWHKLGKKRNQPEYQKAFNKLFELEAPETSILNQRDNPQSSIPKPIL